MKKRSNFLTTLKRTAALIPLWGIIGGLSASATIITVSNNGNSPGQYTNLQDAIDAASPNDTLYVHGSPTSYGVITINKPLTLIGNGWKPNKQYPWPTELDFLYLTDYDHPTDSTIASGSVLMGLLVSNSIFVTGMEEGPTLDVEGVAIVRCKVTNGIEVENTTEGIYSDARSWLVEHSVIGGFFGYNATVPNLVFDSNVRAGVDFTFNNCIITDRTRNLINSTFNHCVFRGSNDQMLTGHSNINLNNVIENCIFDGYSLNSGSGLDGAQINNCLFSLDADLDITNSTAFESDNIEDTDPMFVLDTETLYSDDMDYHLQVGSPAINAGSDGTDIGITGGTNPWPSTTGVPFQNSPLPSMPQIIEMNLVTPFVPSNGTIDVQLNARKQD